MNNQSEMTLDEYKRIPEIKAKIDVYVKKINYEIEVEEKRKYEINQLKIEKERRKLLKEARRKESRSKYLSDPKYREKQKVIQDIKYLNTWTQLFNIYGWKCACCGEDNPAFLTLDHVNGNGKDERAKGITGPKTYKKAIETKNTKEYQILCYNCNLGRGQRSINGVCPHKLPKNWWFDRRKNDKEKET